MAWARIYAVVAGHSTSSRLPLTGFWTRASVALTVAVVLIPYTAWVALALRQGDAQDFVKFGRQMVARSHASSVISGSSAHYRYQGEYGFDGQYHYFIAVDPVNARYYLDAPAYRYTRILYPMLAGILGLQNPDLVPYTLILVNLLMIGIGTLALAAWLRRRGVSPWLAAVVGFYPGIYIALQNDMTEITAYSLVAVAIYGFDFGGRHHLWLSSVAFALALLTRETTALFAGLYALGVLFSGGGPVVARPASQWRTALAWALVAFGPLLVWKTFLLWWLGSVGLEGGLIAFAPFAGLAAWWPFGSQHFEQLRTIAVPGTICCIAAAWAIARGVRAIPVWALLVNSLLLVVFLGKFPYEDISSSGRVTIGVALAAVLSVPYLLPMARAWFWSATALWLTPMLYWFFLPLGYSSASLLLRWLREIVRLVA